MASVTVIFGGQEQSSYQLDRPKLVVGREPNCEIHIDNLGISRQHCAFMQRNDAFLVQDLGSSNGTYVNGRKVTEHFLNDADEIVIGKYTLRFKNDIQPAQPAPGATATNTPVPDTLNTYVMDGAKIQEQLAKMRSSQAGSAAAAAVPTPGGPPATAKDYARALDPGSGAAPAGDVSTLKTLLIVLATVAVVLLTVIVLIMTKVLNFSGGATPPIP